MTLKTTGITVTLLAGALVLAGCSGAPGGKKEEAETPLSKIFMQLSESQDQAYYDKLHQKQEELIASCMQEQGFEYQPNPNSGMMVSSSMEDEGEGPQWGTEEFAKEFGYGIVNQPPMPEPTGPEPDFTDPNGDYYASLTEGEQKAYDEALNGSDQGPVEGEEEEWQWDPSKAGCWGAAQQETDKDQPWNDPQMTALQETMEQMYTAIAEDPETVAANSDWVSCMADAGYPGYAERWDAQNEAYEKQQELYSGGNPDEWKEPSKAALAEFQDYEIELATTDFGCVKSSDIEKRQIAVQIKHEQAYVDEHKAELDALVAKFATQNKK